MKSKCTKTGLTLLFSLYFGAAGYAQQSLGGTAPDPKMLPGGGQTTGAMSNIYSPSLYDGTVNVTIPIYQYSNDAGNFGISFSYNTRGVKVDEIPSDIGSHWNINAEGSIQRVVKGLPDEFNAYITSEDSIYTDVDTRYYAFKGRLAASMETTTQAADPEVYRDGESDDFIVSAGGLSFTFNIGRHGQIYVNSKKDIKVEVLENGVPYTLAATTPDYSQPLLLEFRITDVQGNQYYFKKGTYDDQLMYGPGDAQLLPNFIADCIIVSRWVVTEVSLANGSKIKYNYKYGGRHEYTYTSYSSTDSGPTPISKSVEKKNYAICQLSSIEYPNNVTANFVYDTVKKRLDFIENGDYPNFTGPEDLSGALKEIRVQSGNNCLRYKMYQSYTLIGDYNHPNPGFTPYGGAYTTYIDYLPAVEQYIVGQRTHRLRLDSIRLVSCDGLKEEPYYSFTYDPLALPARFNSAQDYFGYFNGKGNSSLYPGTNIVDKDMTIPAHASAVSGNNFSYGTDRSVDVTKIKAGILSEVKNAYGGKIAFAYEGPGTLDNQLPGIPNNIYFFGPTATDGLRVHSITETDPYYPGNSRITTFDYSGGQLFLTGGYFHALAGVEQLPPPNSQFGIGKYGGNFLTPHQFVNGSNHGYSNVTVTTRDNSNNLLSKKEVLFTNFKDATSNNQPRYQLTAGGKNYYDFPWTDKQYLRDWEMGLPLEITEYDENGEIITKTFNTYAFSIDTIKSVTQMADGIKSSYLHDSNKPSFPLNYMWVPQTAVTDPYKPFFGTAQLSSAVIRKYTSSSSFVADTVQYAYDARNNLSRIITYNSRGEIITTKHYYNYDLPITINGSILPGQERIISTQRWKKIPGQTDSVLLDAFFNRYTYQLSGIRPVKIWNKGLYNLVAGSPLTTAQYATGPYASTEQKGWAAYNGSDIANFRKTTEVILFDNIGDPLETRMINQNQYKAMIWDTLTGQKIAEAANCHYNDIAYTSFEGQHYVMYNTNLAISVNGPYMYQTDGVSGKSSLRLWDIVGSNSAITVSGTQNLTANKDYILSFWSKGSYPAVYIGTTSVAVPAEPVATKGSWKNYILHITPATSGQAIKITGTSINCYLDEVRLHPASASMQTTTYEPLFGVNSTTDATGRITYYEYDELGRRNIVRDQEGNIISKTQYAIHEPQ